RFHEPQEKEDRRKIERAATRVRRARAPCNRFAVDGMRREQSGCNECGCGCYVEFETDQVNKNTRSHMKQDVYQMVGPGGKPAHLVCNRVAECLNRTVKVGT